MLLSTNNHLENLMYCWSCMKYKYNFFFLRQFAACDGQFVVVLIKDSPYEHESVMWTLFMNGLTITCTFYAHIVIISFLTYKWYYVWINCIQLKYDFKPFLWPDRIIAILYTSIIYNYIIWCIQPSILRSTLKYTLFLCLRLILHT